MKKILAIVCALLLACAFPLTAFAEDGTVEQTEIETEIIVTESDAPDITTEDVVGYIKAHFEEISVVITLILTLIYNVRKHKLLDRSIAITNNNAIAVAENSGVAMQNALGKMEAFDMLLAEYRASAEEKKKLEATLNEAMNYIKASKLANVEFANELAELLVLANIPNSKKEELYSRHLAAVSTIAEVEKTEENADDNGKET